MLRRRVCLARSDLYEYHEKQNYPSHKGAIAGLLVVFGAFIVLGVYSLMELWSMYEIEITSLIQTVSPYLADTNRAAFLPTEKNEIIEE